MVDWFVNWLETRWSVERDGEEAVGFMYALL